MTKTLGQLYQQAKKYCEEREQFLYNDYFAYKYDTVPVYDLTKNGLKKYFRAIFNAYSYASPRLLDYIDPKIILSIRNTVDPIQQIEDVSTNMSISLLIDKHGSDLVLNILEGLFDEVNEEYLLGLNKEEVLQVMDVVVESDKNYLISSGIGVRILQPFLMETLVIKNFKSAITKYALPFTVRFANYNEDKMMGVDIVIEHSSSELSLSPLYLQVKPRHQAEWAYSNQQAAFEIDTNKTHDQKSDDHWKQKIARTIVGQNMRADHVLWVGYDFGNNSTKQKRTLWLNGRELNFSYNRKDKFAVGYYVDKPAIAFIADTVTREFFNASGYDILKNEYHREKDKKKQLLTNLEDAQRTDKSDLKAATIYGQKQIDYMFKKNNREVSKRRVAVAHKPTMVNKGTAIVDPLDILYAIAEEDLTLKEDNRLTKSLTKTRKEEPPKIVYDDHYADMPTRGKW